MTMQRLWHFGRLRRAEDREFLRPGLCDRLIINANQMENNAKGTAAYLEETGLSYLVDPMLWRLQLPEWWRNDKGATKKNYARLAARYSAETSVRMAEGRLLDQVPDDSSWEQIGRNVVTYQRQRLSEQTDLFDSEGLKPEGIVAPALVAFGPSEDRLNRLLATSAATAAGGRVIVPFVLPYDRLADPSQVLSALATVARESVTAYMVWTPGVTEELLLTDDALFGALLSVITHLSEHAPVIHSQGSYLTAALHQVGIAGVVHHLGWVDKGEIASHSRGGIRSCQTYLPGLRHCTRFDEAERLGRNLNREIYLEKYCDCVFCTAVFDEGQHPLDLLLEDQLVKIGQRRRTPTSRATTANTWHYLNSRRQEVDAFSTRSAVDVVEGDIARAVALAGQATLLKRLAAGLRSA